MPRVTRSHGRLLFLAFALTVLAFVASSVYREVRLAEIHQSIESLTANALPSIENLVAARSHLHLLVRGAAGRLRGRTAEDDLQRERVVLGEAIRAYLGLPTFPGERDLWPPIERGLEDLDHTLRDIPGEPDACRALRVALHREEDQLDRALGELLLWNARRAYTVGRQIDDLQRHTRQVAAVLNGLSILLAALMAALALRTTDRYTRFLETSGRLLQERSGELEQFAGRVAHDIRQPLQTVNLALDLIHRQPGSPAPPEVLDRTRAAVQRAGQTVEALLAFAQAGARPAPGERAEAGRVVREVLAEVRPLAEEARIGLQGDAEEIEVACSAPLLHVVLNNLVCNAIKYMGEGTERRVTVRVRAEGPRVAFEVQDTGPGVPPDLAGVIFEPYARGPGHRAPGIGLGLATVRRIVESRGGQVGVRVLPERGSLFWFHLPRAI